MKKLFLFLFVLTLTASAFAAFVSHLPEIGTAAPSGTEFVFNQGVTISARTKAESGGNDTVYIWLEKQEL